MADPRRAASPPWFASMYDAFMRPLERRLLGSLRARLLRGLSGRVLEVGTGTGANFPLYASLRREGASLAVTATEPDAAMFSRARRRAEAEGLELSFVEAPAEALPFPDGAFDHVVVTLVLCSVAEPETSLAEIARVLRPGGELRYLEHVRADGLGAWAQDRLRRPWALLGAGCQLNRRTGDWVRQAGFEVLEEIAYAASFPILRLIVGTARWP